MRNTLILAALLAAAPFAASAANGLSYTYVEGGYSHLKLHSSELDDPSVDGAYVRGSYAVSPQLYVFGGYTQLSRTDHADLGGTPAVRLSLKTTISQPELGIGYFQEMTDKVDFVADLGWQRLEVKLKAKAYGDSETGKDHVNLGRLNLGIRGKPSEHTEGWLKVGYIDGEHADDIFDSKFVGTAGLQVSINRTWGIVGEVQAYDGATQASLGVRASF